MSTADSTHWETVATVNGGAGQLGKLRFIGEEAFGPQLKLLRFEMSNGLKLLLVPDNTAPVLAYHSWYGVGSRHEQPGKTGLSHLFEHLMFNETENLPKGEFDRCLEAVGAESNASTWLDFTQYNISAPSDQLALCVKLEADRMENLVLREPQVESEKEVVANERRYRVDDDVEGAISELLWATAFKEHAYKWPTIGWMEDIQGFTTKDCEAFYRTYYAPNNAAIIIAGDIDVPETLKLLSTAYGHLKPAELPAEDFHPEPAQRAEQLREETKPTPTEKLCVGYHGPALGDADHVALSLLCEVLFGGRASRLYERLVRVEELASEVRMFVGPFKDPGLMELYISAREGHQAEELLAVVDEELERVKQELISPEEIQRTQARFELGLLHGLETAEGKAQTIGFYECVLGQPTAALSRLQHSQTLTANDLLRAARRYFINTGRTVIKVRPSTAELAQ